MQAIGGRRSLWSPKADEECKKKKGRTHLEHPILDTDFEVRVFIVVECSGQLAMNRSGVGHLGEFVERVNGAAESNRATIGKSDHIR